jgi:hypothetical protein
MTAGGTVVPLCALCSLWQKHEIYQLTIALSYAIAFVQYKKIVIRLR